ncbi:glycosyltransferase family 4 protein [Dyadobacter psychrotolerans]|uniref:Glycosyltransferase n=1 Tax=Dyadobacter psychrotolerans TaxID=2541721 RepID=A0A4R5DXR4_9BACT|nr:glycosyltransferase family 4 protein [Dyadobacter psychrotolerans]TDE17464.1 glycosyltransferase [Dyadobacter psychrotolerans]
MRILVVHNQLWAHYKSKLFSEINSCLIRKYPDAEFLVAQIALYEAARSGMRDQDNFVYEYPYKVLFDTSLDKVGFKDRLFELIKTFDQFKPTVLNVTGYFDWAQVLLMIYAKTKGVKIVLSSESSSGDHGRSALKEKIKSRIVGMADAFFCFGKTSVDYMISLGVNPSKIAVDNAAVIDEDVVKLNFEESKRLFQSEIARNKTFVFVGRLAEEKNLKMLLCAFTNLQIQEPDAKSWNLLFVGDGPEKQNLEKLALDSPFPDNISFTGGLPWHRVPAWLARSSVLVLPSKSEPWGLVVNEAMVCSMPVIVSEKCGCVQDLVQDGGNGFTFNPDKQHDLEKVLLFYIQNQEQIEIMGAKSANLIKRFSSKKVAEEMVSCYNKL